MPLDSLFLLLAVVFLTVMMLLSSRRRKREAELLKSQVVKGAQVMLTSGIYGKVASISSDRFVLETAPGQKLTVALGAVRSVESQPKSKPAAKSASKATSSKAK